MGSDVVVRPIQLPDDVRRFQLFIKAEAQEMNIPANEALFRADVLLDHAGRGGDQFLLAFKSGALVGFLILAGGRGPYAHTAQLRIHLNESVRGNGVGSALMDAGLAWADEQGLTRLVATPYVAHAEDDSVLMRSDKVRFFRRHGFVLEGRGRKAVTHVDGEYRDMALMARVA